MNLYDEGGGVDKLLMYLCYGKSFVICIVWEVGSKWWFRMWGDDIGELGGELEVRELIVRCMILLRVCEKKVCGYVWGCILYICCCFSVIFLLFFFLVKYIGCGLFWKNFFEFLEFFFMVIFVSVFFFW